MNILLWAKTMKNTRLVKDCVLNVENYSIDNLTDYIKQICYNLDMETPILLSKHYRYIEQYNIVKFTKDDFVDYIDFDYFVIEKSEK